MDVISLFDKTGNMVRPWAEAGYDCHAMTFSTSGTLRKTVSTSRHGTLWQFRINEVARQRLRGVRFWPPCTHPLCLARAGSKVKDFVCSRQSIEMFATRTRDVARIGAPYRNPVDHINLLGATRRKRLPAHYTAVVHADDYTSKPLHATGRPTHVIAS